MAFPPRRVRHWPAVLLPIAVIAACRSPVRELADAAVSEEWTRSYPLSENGNVIVFTRDGSVKVEGVEGASTVEVAATKVARAKSERTASGLLPSIPITESVTPDRVEVRTGRIEGILVGASYEVSYRVRVPSNAKVRAEAVNGAVEVSSLNGSVVALSNNGNVTGTALAGAVEARVRNGALHVSMRRVADGPISLRSMNGAITLSLPQTTRASVNAQARNGSISTGELPFEPTSDAERGRSPRVRGSLNGGNAPLIDLQSTNGNITLVGNDSPTP